jgi:hypothetical protein
MLLAGDDCPFDKPVPSPTSSFADTAHLGSGTLRSLGSILTGRDEATTTALRVDAR